MEIVTPHKVKLLRDTETDYFRVAVSRLLLLNSWIFTVYTLKLKKVQDLMSPSVGSIFFKTKHAHGLGTDLHLADLFHRCPRVHHDELVGSVVIFTHSGGSRSAHATKCVEGSPWTARERKTLSVASKMNPEYVWNQYLKINSYACLLLCSQSLTRNVTSSAEICKEIKIRGQT